MTPVSSETRIEQRATQPQSATIRRNVASKKRRQITAVPALQTGASIPKDRTIRAEADATRPYASVSYSDFLYGLIRHIPTYGADEITAQFGAGVWGKMALDPMIDSAIWMIVNSVVNGIPAAVPVDNDDPIDIRLAEFVTASLLSNKPISFVETVRMALRDALLGGNSISEITLRIDDQGFYRLRGLTPIDTCLYLYVRDAFGNLIGVAPTFGVYTMAGQLVAQDAAGDVFDAKGVIPEFKLLHVVWDRQGVDPRGRSTLASSFKAWSMKKRIEELMLAFTSIVSKRTWVGILPEGAKKVCIIDPVTGAEVEIDPNKALAEIVADLAAGSGAVIPHGSEIKSIPIDSATAGPFFLAALEWCDRQILRGIQTRMMASAGNISSSTEGENDRLVMSALVQSVRVWIEELLTEKISRLIVEMNFGEKFEGRIPRIVVGTGDGLPTTLTDVGLLHQSGWWTPAQKQAIDRKYGFPAQKTGESIIGVNGGQNKNQSIEPITREGSNVQSSADEASDGTEDEHE